MSEPLSVNVDESAIARIKELREQKNTDKLWYSLKIMPGGCSGFKLLEDIVDTIDENDVVFDDTFVTDRESLPLLNGSIVSFKRGLHGAYWDIENPNARGGCGCGSSVNF